jgi:hypothetical protein
LVDFRSPIYFLTFAEWWFPTLVYTGITPANDEDTTMPNALAHSVPEACGIACAGRTVLYQAIRTGALRAVKRGRRTLILDDDLRRWVQALPSVAVKSPNRKDWCHDKR